MMPFDYSHCVTPQNLTIDVELVRHLLAEHFPQWANLSVTPVARSGWDNRTFHLGDSLSVRLPSAAGYAAQVEKEQRWLPQIAPQLPLPIPVPVAMGIPSEIYPWHWSVYRWLEGENASAESIADLSEFAVALAEFLRALHRIDPADAPPPGMHNFYRGASPGVYDAETRHALAVLSDEIDTALATEVWEEALASEWKGAPIWVHGDVAAGNLLVQNGKLSAVIDFGCCAVGDPACDLVIAWTLFTKESRKAFCSALPLDNGTWARGRGWALWKALITLAEYRETNRDKADDARSVLEEILSDHRTCKYEGIAITS